MMPIRRCSLPARKDTLMAALPWARRGTRAAAVPMVILPVPMTRIPAAVAAATVVQAALVAGPGARPSRAAAGPEQSFRRVLLPVLPWAVVAAPEHPTM